MSYGNRWDQTKASERHGTDGYGQASDGTGEPDHLAKYNDNGSVTDSDIPVADILTTTGAGGTTKGLTAGGYGSWYGQVPRGAVNGSNQTFLLDYKLLNPYTVLTIGNVQLPSIQGDPSSTFATMTVPGGEYSITGFVLTVANPPQPGQRFYIEFFRADPASVATGVTLTVTSSYTPDPVALPTAAISIYGTSFAFGQSPQKSSNSGWAKTTDTFDVTSTLLPTQLTSLTGIEELNIYFFTEFGANGTGFDSRLRIHDAFLTVTYADLSTQVFRPTSYSLPDNSTIAQMIEAPPTSSSAYAIDTDADTYAEYKSTAWATLANPTAFIVGGFAPYSSTAGLTPSASPTGTHTETLNDSSGPIMLTSGDYLYVTGVPN